MKVSTRALSRKFVVAAWLLSLVVVLAGEYKVGLTWSPNSETDLKGYRLYWGTNSGTNLAVTDFQYTTNILAPSNVVHVSVTGGTRWVFAVTAYNEANLESELSLPVTVEFDSPTLAAVSGFRTGLVFSVSISTNR